MSLKKRFSVTLLFIIPWFPSVAALTEASTGFVWDSDGRVNYGPYQLIADEKGGLHLQLHGRLLLYRMGVSTGMNGHTPYSAFTDTKLVKKKGLIHFEGKADQVVFKQSVTTEGNRLKFSLERKSKSPIPWWNHFSINLPMMEIGRNHFRIDGQQRLYPEVMPENNLLDDDVKELKIHSDRPGTNLIFETEGNLAIYDGRKWKRPSYVLHFYFGRLSNTRLTFYLTLPDPSTIPLPKSAHPAIRMSRIGYPLQGEKRVVLEWLPETVRPNDYVTLKKADGTIVKRGRFGKTTRFMGLNYAIFDFSSIKEVGDYRISWSGGLTPPFSIKNNLFSHLWEPTLQVFIPWQMCHADVDVGEEAPRNSASHMDDGIRAPAFYRGVDGFRSYESRGTPFEKGERISHNIGGWHDAGDYDLNVSSQGFVVWQLALAHEEFNINGDQATLNINKQSWLRGNPDGKPDILQQVAWGARWLLGMQQKDGRIYVGVVAQPDRYDINAVPEQATDNRPGTGDERHVYVDYHPDSQLKGVIALAAAGRVLKKWPLICPQSA